MAAKQTPISGSLMVETVGTSMTINRIPVAGTPPSVAFGVSFAYADHTYLVDDQGEKTKLLATNESPKFIGLTPEQAMAFYATPMKTIDGEETSLGEFIADLWDQAIREAEAPAL